MVISTSALGVIATLLCVCETYHFLCHACILFRVRMLPRKDLVRVRAYFFFDMACVFITCILVTGKAKLMCFVQALQHGFYFFTWNKSALARKVISWSSLDWLDGPTRYTWAPLEVIGTGFDASCHIVCIYYLSHLMSTVQLFVAVTIGHCLVYLVLFNARFAWTFPRGNVPAWVKKRIMPITNDMNPAYMSVFRS